MAGGKQTPRQKMVNLMYLVFIAMMALNMSKEVLTAFGLINESLVEANENATQRNTAFMAGLAEKAVEQPKTYVPLQEKAKQVQTISSKLNNYVATLKEGGLATVEDASNYELMDNSSYYDEKFYQSKVTKEGAEFVAEVDNYRDQMIALLGENYPEIIAEVKDKFSTDKVTNSKGEKIDWIYYNFVGYPLVASITKFTQMQNSIKTIENEIFSKMLQGEQASQLSMSNYEAIVVPTKTAFFSGEQFEGKVVLGRFDNTLTFDKVIVNEKELENQTGQVELKFPAGNVGQQDITGELQFKEGDSIVSIPIKSSYTVIPEPNSAVISADKMNVVYRGVKNPMTISIPGVPSVNANAPGLSSAGKAGSYVMDVTNVKSREVKINVSGELPGGKTVSSSKVFRIKEIPRPVGVLGAKDGSNGIIRMSRNQVEVSPVGATLPDFDFDLKLNVSGFKFQVTGKPAVQVSGNRLTGSAKAALAGAKRGSTVQIFDIKATISGNGGYKLPKVAPLVIELTN
ncbi:protein involved in gliding motility GldM [Mesonia phycicola]|uniref:Protein involved in gliding motility GldM n=1 Tax=Mesonia phycicola TaxID=579105 RepID=A0A1M6EYH0_9FLAO|nr:gliding motility protein GldM [Mesonia phycicola]SHI90465.1 protein involved in gliding motility GldM [Mesonia phycicola]